MALQVWIPLNGNIENYGLSTVRMTAGSATAYDNDGKIGKCAVFNDNTNSTIYDNDRNTVLNYTDNFSWALWICNQYNSQSTASGRYAFTVGRADAGTWGYGLGSNSNNLVLRFGNTAWSIAVTDGEWTHIAFTKKGNEIKTYKNGVLYGNYTFSGTLPTYSESEASGLGLGCFYYAYRSKIYPFTGKLNDFRIYNHCLSQKEISEIVKGLYLHWRLDDPYIEKTTNIARQPIYQRNVNNGDYGWDFSKHPNSVIVSNWAVGYNGGVGDPAHGYHACWKMIDDTPTMVFVDKNSEISQTHRWLGISGGISGTDIPSNTIYTVSFDARADEDGKYISSGVYYRRTSSDSYNFHDGLASIGLSKEWKRYSYTRTTQTVDYINSLYVYGHYGVEGTSYVKNIQVELKDHATPYSVGSRTDNTVYDSSGYDRNGITDGNIYVVNEGGRYNRSTYIANDTSYVGAQENFMSQLTNCTVSWWYKPVSIRNTVQFMGQSGYFYIAAYNSSNFYNEGTGLDANLYVDGVEKSKASAGSDYRYYNATMLSGWHHYCFTGLDLSAWTTFKLGGYGSWQINGYTSDVRIYATALSQNDVIQIYNKAMSIDHLNNAFAYEFYEDITSKVVVKQNGVNYSNSLTEKNDDFYSEYPNNLLSYSNLTGHGSSWTLQSETYKSLVIYKNVVTSPNTGNNAGFRIISPFFPSGLSSATYLTISFYKRLNTIYGLNLYGYITLSNGSSTTTRYWSWNKENWANDSSSIGKWEFIYSTVSIPTGYTTIQYMYVYYDRATGGDCDFCRVTLEMNNKPTMEDLSNVYFDNSGNVVAGRIHEL